MPLAPEYLHLVFPDQAFNALLYGRNSRDPKKKGRSVEDQLADGRALCDRFGWPVLEEFKDTGISASRHGRKTRDDFEALLDTIETGVARIVVAFEASRYYRDLGAYVELRNACHEADVLLCYNGTVYDLSKRDDRRATAMDAVNAEDEAEGTRDRIIRTARRTAEAGGAWGHLVFGYRRKYDESTGELIGQFEDEIQGPIVVEQLKRVDGGGSLHSVIKSLKNNPDAKRADGSEWTDNNVKYMLLNRVYLGERLHHGKAVKAKWKPLEGLETPEGRALFRRVTQILTDPARGGQFDSRVKHLLTGIPLCGSCGDGTPLKSNQRGATAKKLNIYTCSEKRDVSVSERMLDAYVEEALLSWLRNKDQACAALLPDEAQVADDVRRAQSLLETYRDEMEEARRLNRTRNEQGRPLLSLASLSQKELELLPQIEELEGRLQKATGVPLLIQQLLIAPDPEEAWNGGGGAAGLSLEQKREAIRQIVTVRVHKATTFGRKFNPERVRLSFVGTDGFRVSRTRARGTVRGRAGARAAARETE